MNDVTQQAKNRVDAAIDNLGKVVEELTRPATPTLEQTARMYSSDAAQVADMAIGRRFRTFAATLSSKTDLETYFHPMNRSNWQTDFANWLIEQNRQASND